MAKEDSSLSIHRCVRVYIMLLGKVIGTVWATRKDEQLVGMKFLIVREIELDGTPTSNFIVAADSVGAGVHERVLVAQGSSGRQTKLTHKKPIDAVIMAIVDRLDVVEGEVRMETRGAEVEPVELTPHEPEPA